MLHSVQVISSTYIAKQLLIKGDITMAANNMFDVAGKHCIVTGGAQGLSRGMAEALLENGCKVVLVDVQKDKLEKVCAEYNAKGYQAYAVVGNLADRADINRLFDEAMAILGGKLDVLIPAAGIQRRHLPEEFPMEEWDLVLNINLNHVFIMIQKALNVMLKQSTGGKIITVGSMVTWFGGTTVPAYTASKGAVSQLTKSIAVDCAGRGININALCPGYMDTEMCANMTQARKDECTQRIPAGRWGTSADLKGPVLFLASSASDYLNGATIPVDGGYLVK
jgi:2-deoxy-D-gluconate 3-dehydrogenase